MRDGLGLAEVLGDPEESKDSFYLYPTVFSGNMDISKAKVGMKIKRRKYDTPASHVYTMSKIIH